MYARRIQALIMVFLTMLVLPIIAESQTTVTVPAGQRLMVRLDSRLSSDGNDTNDRFTAMLASDIAVNGAVALRHGDKIHGRILEAKKGGRVVRKAAFACELRDIVRGTQTHPIITFPFEIEGERTGDIKKIAVKAALGGVIGGSDMAKRMAASGTAIAVITSGNQIELPEGVFVEFYLKEPLTVPALTAPVQLDLSSTALNYSKAWGANAKALMEYRWRSRIEIKKDEEIKSTKEMLVSFENGKQKLEPIGYEQEKSKRGLRGKIQKKKQKKAKELVDSVSELVGSYAMMSAGQTVDFLQKSAWSPAGGELNGTVQFEGVDVLNPGDWLTLWIDMQTYQPRKLYFKAAVGEDAVQAEIDFSNLESGIFYAAETHWAMPTKELKGTVENTEHHRL
jgi:hypothetical protein